MPLRTRHGSPRGLAALSGHGESGCSSAESRCWRRGHRINQLHTPLPTLRREAGTTCEEEPIVATYRETTARDVVLRPAKPMTVKIGAGEMAVFKTLTVKLVSADPRGGQPIPVRLTAADGTCPPGTVNGLPDLDRKANGVQDTVLLAGAKTVKARVPLLVAAADFHTHNRRHGQRRAGRVEQHHASGHRCRGQDGLRVACAR